MSVIPFSEEERLSIITSVQAMDFYSRIEYLFKKRQENKDRGLLLNYPVLQSDQGYVFKYKGKNPSNTLAYFYCDESSCSASATVNVKDRNVNYPGTHYNHLKSQG